MPQVVDTEARRKELTDLDAYLSSDESPERSLALSDLDGFLHGIACSPVAIAPSEWLGVALGTPPEAVPGWVLETILALHAAVLDGLTNDPPEIEPMFYRTEDGDVIAMDWCEGFMEAVKLRADAWGRFIQSKQGAELMFPILIHMVDEDGNSMFGLSEADLDEALAQAAEAIPTVVLVIFELMRPT